MRELINQLKSQDELLIVNREVKPDYELAAVTRAVQRSSNKTILFEQVSGTKIPVVANVYNNRQRLCNVMGSEPNQFCERWNELYDRAQALNYEPIQIIDRPSDLVDCQLSDLPLITYHSRDAGAYFTSAIFLAKHPLTGIDNLSFHRGMYVSDTEVRVRLGSSHDLFRYQAIAEKQGDAIDAVMLIGGDPELFLAAGATLPEGSSEIAFASAVKEAPIPCYKAINSDLLIPVSTEIVVEGRILPNVKRPEGPFGEFMGYYVEVGDNNVFEVLSVYTKPTPTYHSLLCGSNEDVSLLEARVAAKTFRHLNKVVPGIIDIACLPSVMNTTIKIKQQYEGHARQVLMAAFGAHLDYNKVCIVVDEDINIFDLNEVMWAFATRGRADTRTMVISDVPGFYRDIHKDHWGRLGLDATYPFGRAAEFERKFIPGEDNIDLSDYF